MLKHRKIVIGWGLLLFCATLALPGLALAVDQEPGWSGSASSSPMLLAKAGAETGKLPAAVGSRLQKMAKELEKADNTLTKGVASLDWKVGQARSQLAAAQALWDEIQKGYAAQAPADHPEMQAAAQRMAQVQAKLDQAAQELGQAQGAKAEAAQAKAGAEAVSKQWQAKLEPFVKAGPRELLPPYDDASWEKMKPVWAELKPLWEEFQKTDFPGGKSPELQALERFLGSRVQNFLAVAKEREKKEAAAAQNQGRVVFGKSPLDPASPAGQTSFQTGENIYGLIVFTKPMGQIWGSSATILVNVSVDGKALRVQSMNISDPGELKKSHLVFNLAPAPDKMTDYANPNIKLGKVGDLNLGPVFISKELAQLAPGKHTVAVKVDYYGENFAKGEFVLEGQDYAAYAALHEKLKAAAAQTVTLPKAQMTNKALEEEVKALLVNAGWPTVLRLNIVDKDWWLDRASGGDSPVVSRRMDAAALAQAADGSYYYCLVSFQQPRLITGDWGKLEIMKVGAKHVVPKENIDR